MLTTKLDGYFYFHGLRGMLKQLNRVEDARVVFRREIAFAHSVAEANHIRRNPALPNAAGENLACGSIDATASL